MHNMYEIFVFSHDGEVPCVRTEHKLYGKNYATKITKEIGGCDNVNRVEMIDATTGELLLAIEDSKTVWETEY